MSDYAINSLKRDPDTGDIAIRTMFPEDQGQHLADMAWLVASSSRGARNASSAAVASWTDIPPSAWATPGA